MVRVTSSWKATDDLIKSVGLLTMTWVVLVSQIEGFMMKYSNLIVATVIVSMHSSVNQDY